jgi:hypothetical protein
MANYDQDANQAWEKMSTGMCWPWDWFREDLPIETKDGDALQKMVEGIVDQDLRIPKTFETLFDKAPIPEKAELPKPPGPERDSVLVFADSVGYYQKLLAAVPEGRLGTKKIVDKWANMSDDEVKKLVNSQKGGWDLILFMASIDPPASNHVNNVIAQEALVAELYLNVLKAIQSTENAKRLAVITRGVMCEDRKQHNKYGLGMITSALMFGMSNSARQEFEEQSIQYIDTEWSLKATGEADKYNLFPRLATECFRLSTFGHNNVRILNKGRYVVREMDSSSFEEANVEFKIPEKGTIAISGGNGALGLVMGGWFLDKCQEKGIAGLEIKFCSRSMKIGDLNIPPWESIQARAKEMGITVGQSKLDMGTQEAVDKFINANSPNLVGFIHSAGVLQDSMLMNLTWEKCEAVFNSKHRPALYLHSALERYKQDNLMFVWLFTSVAVWGNMGQINYSGSNHFLDALSRHRVAKGLPCCGMQWGAWGEVGMAATMSDSMRARTMAGPCPYFTNVEGLQGMEIGLKTGLPGFSVFKFSPGVMFGMVAPDHNVTACYTRNWYSELCPNPPSGDIGRPEGINSAIRTNVGLYQKTKKERLIYDYYTKPLKDMYEEEWGDDFRKWK